MSQLDAQIALLFAGAVIVGFFYIIWTVDVAYGNASKWSGIVWGILMTVIFIVLFGYIILTALGIKL